MMRKCRLKTRCVALFSAGFFIFSLHGFSQQIISVDSIPTGIIFVKRPSVPASFISKCAYVFPKEWDKKRPWESRVKTAHRGYQAWLAGPSVPQPVEISFDSSHPQIDSVSGVDYVKAERSKFPTIFNWSKFLSTINHDFSWLDTMRVDSAWFQYSVDANGNSICTPLPWNKTDSSSRKLEQEALPLMKTLKFWYPAQHISNRTSKLENLPCVVTVTIYAYENNGESPPSIIVDSGKGK